MISADMWGDLQEEVTLTTWAHARKSVGGTTRTLTWQALADEYRSLAAVVREKARLIAPAFCTIRPECRPGGCDYATDKPLPAHRCSKSVLSVTAIGLDYDGKQVDWPDVVGKLDAIGLAYLVHDSPSHHVDAPKWRLYIPITEPCTDLDGWGGKYNTIRQAFESLLGVEFDDKTTDACRIFYPPTRPVESEPARRVEWHSGKALDLAKLLSASIAKPQENPTLAPLRGNEFSKVPVSIVERASRYLSQCDASIQGQDGSGAAFHAATALVLGFNLPEDLALSMLLSEFNPRCQPPWSKKELKHKVHSVATRGQKQRGYLLSSSDFVQPAATKASMQNVEEVAKPSPPATPSNVKASMQNIEENEVRPLEENDGPPPLRLIMGRDKPKSGFANLKEVLTNAPEFWRKLRLNDFAHVVEIHGTLPWKPDPTVRVWRDADDVEASAYIETTYGFSSTPVSVYQTVGAVGEARKYHPVRDYLLACRDRWDATKRIDTWLLDAGGCRVNEDGEDAARKNSYVRSVGRRFLIAAVARIFRPGCKVDSVLILEGLQGKRKSSLVKTLFSEPWFTDQLADVGSKAADEQLAGRWGIEIPELDATKGASATKEKAFFSRSTDRFRPAYGRAVVEYPRTCVFVGTTNKGQYLKDETGARRFQPVAVQRLIDTDAIARDRDQLWAEAVLCYECGEQWWLTDEEAALAAEEQEERYEVDVIEAKVAEYVRHKREVTVDAIMTALFESGYGGHSQERYSQSVASRVGKALKHLGWVQVRIRDASQGRVRVYRPHDWLLAGLKTDETRTARTPMPTESDAFFS